MYAYPIPLSPFPSVVQLIFFWDNCKLRKIVTFPGVRPTKVRGSLHDSNQVPDTRNLERDSSLDSRPGRERIVRHRLQSHISGSDTC